MTAFLKSTVAMLAASTALAGCSSDMRPSYPIYPPSPMAAPPPAEVAPLEPVAPSVEASPLPPSNPSPAVESRSLPPLEPPPAAPPRYTPPAAPPPRPAQRVETVTERAVSGPVVSVTGEPETYTVRKGDNLAKVARQFDMSVEQVAKANKLREPYRLQPGDVIKGRASTVKAYVVGSKDTLSAVARRFSVSVDALSAENDLPRNAGLRPGQKLRLPGGYRDKGPLVTTSRVVRSEPAPEKATAPPAQASGPEPAAESSSSRVDQTAVRTVTERSVTGRVVEVSGPATSYTVKKGDNLTQIAERLDTSVEQLAKDNKLKKPYIVRPGVKLRGPLTTQKAYVAGQGDNITAIARRFSVTPDALRRENGLKRTANVRPGQKLTLPRGYRDKGPLTVTTRLPVSTGLAPVRPAPAAQAPSPSSRTYAPATVAPTARPYTPPSAQPYATPPAGAPVSAPPLGDSQISQLGRGRFVWPVRGDIIAGFGPKAVGQRNDGLNIRVAAGAPVRAAAGGDVVYAGDQVPGFGNLVLVKHADGWVTAYAHLSRVDVKMQDKVAQGQQIGQAGASGGVPEPQLHFEVRYAPSPLERARPIDPALVLPQ